MNCPNCGAAVSVESTQCQYCHALLETVACPQCMGMMFVGSKFCPHCGAIVSEMAQAGATAEKCPRCHIALQKVKVADTPLEECTRCGGLWMEVACFEHLCELAEAQAAATVFKMRPPPFPLPPVEYLHCPTCGEIMNRMNYAGRSGVVIHVCKPHGVWLDHDEMPHIVQFIRSGGLDQQA